VVRLVRSAASLAVAAPAIDDVLDLVAVTKCAGRRSVETRKVRLRNHTLRLTRAWLAKYKVQPEPVLEWLEEHGGFCECEVVLNAAFRFEELRHRR
jgi:hypothetical protein